jgi:hypothetical protein
MEMELKQHVFVVESQIVGFDFEFSFGHNS